MSLKLRPYQVDALRAIKAKYDQGITRQLVALPTGTGKTVLFASLPSYFPHFGKMLVLAHTEELVDQAVKSIHAWNPSLNVGKEMAEHKCSPFAHVVVGSVPTLGRAESSRIYKFDRSLFNIIVIDEAHHSVASTYLRICQYFGLLTFDNRKLLLGVTATPNRSDDKGLNHVFQDITYEMGIRKAIEDGWLVDLKGYRINSAVSLDDVETRDGDFVAGSLARTVNTELRNELIVKYWYEYAQQRQTVIFCATIQHAKELAAAFQKRAVPAEAVWGDDADRKRKLEEHRNKKIRIITNCMVLKEGYDDWQVSCIVMARPTMSQLLFAQMIGRGTRIPKDVGNLLAARAAGHPLEKEDCITIDVADNTRRHKLITLPTLFGLPPDTDLRGESATSFNAPQGRLVEQPRPSVLEKARRLTTVVEEIDLLDRRPGINTEIHWHRDTEGTWVSDRGLFRLHRDTSHWVLSAELNAQSYVLGDFGSMEAAVAWAKKAIRNPAFTSLLKFFDRRAKLQSPHPCRADRLLLSYFGYRKLPPHFTHQDAAKLLMEIAVSDLKKSGGRQLLRAMSDFLKRPKRRTSGVLRYHSL